MPPAAAVLAALSATPRVAQSDAPGEAVCGEPFGVGRISVNLPRDALREPLGAGVLRLHEKDGRALYPAVAKPPLGGFFADLVGAPQGITIYFLFRGKRPLELTLPGRSGRRLTLPPRDPPLEGKQESPADDRAAYKKLLRAWWQQYTAPPGLLEEKPDSPPLVENYLAGTLARRLHLELPKRQQPQPWRDELEREVGLMLGTESVRTAIEQQRILGLADLDQVADQPLPEPIRSAASEVPSPAADVQVEPIALRVPAECFYLRFGSYSNFLWFQDTLARWGGDLRNLLAARGLDYGITTQMENRLVLKQTELSRLLGDTLIADVALVGTDTFFREGAAFGALFLARNSTLLGAEIARQRLERLAARGVKQRKLTVEGREVSLLASPDGAVRSYYAADGDYHFVTTSKALVKRFFETVPSAGQQYVGSNGQSAEALGRSKAFRHARSVMPLARKDTVFVYLSDAFFRSLTGPRYRVETARRLQAGADIDLVRLARLAAAAEGKPSETIAQLVAGGLLPPDFGPRPDGGRTVLAGGEVYDSLRGRPGALRPVPDVPVNRVTRAEASAYRKFADLYRKRWGGRMDPIIIGIKRHALSGNQERVVLDVHLSPFAQQHFDLLSRWAGPPSRVQLAPIGGDLAAGQLVMHDQHLFAGLADFRPPLKLVGHPFAGTSAMPLRWQVLPVGRLRDLLVGYVGTSGESGLLDFLDVQILRRPDEHGYSRNMLGLWRRQFDGFTVFSFHKDVLAAVTPQLRFEEAPRPAQLRLRVGDLSEARMTPLLNDLGYVRTRETSLGNLRFLARLSQQLHVPAKEAREVAEDLLGAKLVCPLGGQYVFQRSPEGRGWTSTALQGPAARPLADAAAPEGYQAPLVGWFRGLELDVTMSETLLSAHAEVLMQLPGKE